MEKIYVKSEPLDQIPKDEPLDQIPKDETCEEMVFEEIKVRF